MIKKIIIGLFVLSLFSAIVGAEELSEYPDFFIDDGKLDTIIVVGDRAPATHVLAQTDILLSLGRLVGDVRGKTRLASEVNDTRQNIISIGNACINEVSAAILGKPEKCSAEKAQILFFEEDGNFQIVLNANSENAIRSLAKQLADYDSADFSEVIDEDEIPEEAEEEIEEKETEPVKDSPIAVFNMDNNEEITGQEDAVEVEENNDAQPIIKEENLITKFISWIFNFFKQK